MKRKSVRHRSKGQAHCVLSAIPCPSIRLHPSDGEFSVCLFILSDLQICWSRNSNFVDLCKT